QYPGHYSVARLTRRSIEIGVALDRPIDMYQCESRIDEPDVRRNSAPYTPSEHRLMHRLMELPKLGPPLELEPLHGHKDGVRREDTCQRPGIVTVPTVTPSRD